MCPPRRHQSADAAVDHRARVDAGGGEHAGGDRGARAALADRHHRLAVGDRRPVGAQQPVRDVLAARDEAGVALVELAHVDHVDLAAAQELREIVHLDRLGRLELPGPVEVALQLEEPDSAQAPGGELGLLGRRGVQDDPLATAQHEAGLRPEAAAGDRDVERAVDVARRRTRRRSGRRGRWRRPRTRRARVRGRRRGTGRGSARRSAPCSAGAASACRRSRR